MRQLVFVVVVLAAGYIAVGVISSGHIAKADNSDAANLYRACQMRAQGHR
jgi:hypothetical protein